MELLEKTFYTIAFLKTSSFEKKILLTIMVTIVKEGLSLTIINETTNFIKKTVIFEEKITCNFVECCLT